MTLTEDIRNPGYPWADSVRCPECGAAPRRHCSTPSGAVRVENPHLARRKEFDRVLALAPLAQQMARARAAPVKAPIGIYVVKVTRYDGEDVLERGVYGPYSEEEAEELAEELNHRPRWDRHLAVVDALRRWDG